MTRSLTDEMVDKIRTELAMVRDADKTLSDSMLSTRVGAVFGIPKRTVENILQGRTYNDKETREKVDRRTQLYDPTVEDLPPVEPVCGIRSRMLVCAKPQDHRGTDHWDSKSRKWWPVTT